MNVTDNMPNDSTSEDQSTSQFTGPRVKVDPVWGWTPRHWAELIVVAVLVVVYLVQNFS